MDLRILKNEFDAGDGSFLISIKGHMHWDVEAFDRLCSAMAQYCRETPGTDVQLERWAAQGFWYVPWFVRNWTSHPNFPRDLPVTYYENAYQQLDDLAFSYFFGYGDPKSELGL
ncbi:hypothetical protein [Mesorhizobium sp.]|uniref:hypothetical protein n=1 Tax=Mesorhizobium sp. TaxID=1871066 RepID=UPI000FE97CB3|nr:hypothetical protein [Mesorhizobium sp.]RWD26323.1 MAG: hypothetical protein EOS33_21075 [Mesorhizobium sp.]